MSTKLNPDAIQDKSITADKLLEDYYTNAEVDVLLEEIREDIQKEYLPLTPGGTSSQFVKGNGSLDSNIYCKIQTVPLLTARGNITKNVYNDMVAADVVKVLYGGSTGNPQYELTMTSKERSGGLIAYSTIFFSAGESVFKSFSVAFAAPSSSSNAVSYQVTMTNLTISATTVSE